MGTHVRRALKRSQKSRKSMFAARKTGKASVSRESRGRCSGEMYVSATLSHRRSMVQRLAPRKMLMASCFNMVIFV
jgi:hypothetical protein